MNASDTEDGNGVGGGGKFLGDNQLIDAQCEQHRHTCPQQTSWNDMIYQHTDVRATRRPQQVLFNFKEKLHVISGSQDATDTLR